MIDRRKYPEECNETLQRKWNFQILIKFNLTTLINVLSFFKFKIRLYIVLNVPVVFLVMMMLFLA